jgi:polyisoprenoid-binding protein YceI
MDDDHDSVRLLLSREQAGYMRATSTGRISNKGLTEMAFRHLFLAGAAAFALAACGEQKTTQSAAAPTTEAASAQQAAEAVEFNAPSGEYATDPSHRYITFTYVHQGYSEPWLRWRDWTGTLDWNAEDPSASSVSVTINADAIDSGVDVFDGHLKGENFFDTANHPEITFVSTSVEKTGANTGTIAGDLTIKGITKPATLNAVFNKGQFEERGGIYKLGFSATTSVNRSDFGMDYAVPIVSDQVDIVIETEWAMPAPANE